MADDMWVITPPLSPNAGRRSVITSGNGEGFQFHCFTCAGEASRKDMKLHPNGYVMNGELKSFCDRSSLLNGLGRNPMVLFERHFDQDASLLFNSKLLFQIARKDLMMLESASRLNAHLLSSTPSLQADVNYMQLRKQICELLAFVRSYIARVLTDENSIWLLDSVIPSLSSNLYSLRLLLRNLKDLPDFVVNHSSSPHGNKCPQPSYHLFHAHLDLRWYHLTVLHQLVRCHTLSITLDDSQDISEQRMQVNRNTFEEFLLLLLSDLITIAIDKFERTQLNALLKRTPFSCTCVRELWLMMQLYINRLHQVEHGKSFWTYVNQLLDIVLGKKAPGLATSRNCSALRLPDSYKCSESVTCCLWLLTHLAQLNGYNEDGQYVGVNSGRVESNYPQLEAVLKACVSGNCSLTEPQLRVVVRLVSVLVTEWWELRTEPIMMLWEYYHRRLNSAFFVPGAAPESMAVMSKTGAGLLEQVKSRLESSAAAQDEDSFSLFLGLLGRHLLRCAAHNQPRHWQQMKGRIYAKFSPNKMLTLTEMGLYHFVSLFLTLAVTVDFQEVGKKMQDLLGILPVEMSDLNRQHVKIKANVALLQLYVERGQDIADISRPLLLLVMELSTHKSGNSFVLMRTFVEGVQDVMDASQSLQLSEYSLIGGWVASYLSNGSVSDCCRLLDTVISVMTKLRQSLHSSQARSTMDALVQHVMPYIQAQCCSASQPPFQVADLAAGFTLLALECPDLQTQSFDQLFTYFASSDRMNVKLTKRYLCHVLLEEAALSLIADPSLEYESLVIQAWIRCSLLSVNESSEELGDLTKIVSRLPAIQDICQGSTVCLASIDDPLFTFIKLVGHKYKGLQDIHRKATFREKCQLYFKQLDKCVSSVIGCATSSIELVSRIYVCCACMVCHCGQILYMKSKPNCLLPSLVNLLLLPHAVYKPETQLHPFIAAALKKTLHQFILGISRLNPRQDDFIARVLKDIIVQYLPRLAPKPGLGGGCGSHPLLRCFTLETEDSEIGKVVLEALSSKFFTCRGSVPHEQAALALGFFVDLLNLKKCNLETISQIISASLLRILELSMFAEDGNVARKTAVQVVQIIANSEVLKQNTDLRESFDSVFMMLCQRHLAFSSVYFFRLSVYLAQLCPEFMTRCLPKLKDFVKTVEQRRGVGYDHGLRNNLAKLTAVLGLQDT